ncbi:T-lymphocyte surface antigen Ly-9 isoform X2 [Eulemur rufifrons]|uniref:T-lymphocyte surface antigen Ly-9 isoform X2 n=1 Tax=Eulemur rufifrons TaxID=859984 RepID=UPI0037443676
MAGPKSHTDDWALGPFSNKPQKSQPQIFSSVLWTSLLFLLMGLRASGKDSAPTVVSGILGDSMTLSLNISGDTEIEHVTWNGPKDTLIIAYPKGNIILVDKSYHGRLNTSWSYSLYISNLTLKDAGTYKAQINQKNSEVTTKEEFILHIYEQLQEPQVTVKSAKVSENSSCNITLRCSVKGTGTGILYSWTPRDPHASESNDGSILTIFRMPCHRNPPYTCTVRNPVSVSRSRPVRAQQFCTGPGASKRGAIGETVLGILGEPITLPLALPARQDIDNVVWMFNTSTINKGQEEAATADPLIKSRDPFKSRVWVSGRDHSLKIDPLKMEDAGPYHAYVCSKASRGTSMTHVTLLIYRRLAKPKVTWSLGHTKDGTCRITLTCSVEDGGNNMTYTWAPLPKGALVSQGGSRLNISWRSGENHPNFTCTASNPVSSSSIQFLSENLCPGPEIHLKSWIVLIPMVFLLCSVIFCWRIWRHKRQRSAPAFGSSPVEAPAVTPGYEKLDSPHTPARQQPRPTSDSSSDSSITTEEDEESPEKHKPVNGRDKLSNLVTQEGTGHDSASEGQAEYDLVAPDDTVAEPVVEGNTVYMQVFFNSQGQTPVPQKKDNSVTIYSSVQKSQTVVLPPQQNNPESPEIPTYENLT